jgi:hypothetical protein
MIVMWKIERGIPKIARVECTRVTGASVWFMKLQFQIGSDDLPPVETKAARLGNVSYHATWEDAHTNLLEHAALHVQWQRRQLEIANAYHGNVKGLRKPAESEERPAVATKEQT